MKSDAWNEATSDVSGPIGEHHRELPVEVALALTCLLMVNSVTPSMPVNVARAVSRNAASAAEPCSWARRKTTVCWIATLIFFLGSRVGVRRMRITGLGRAAAAPGGKQPVCS